LNQTPAKVLKIGQVSRLAGIAVETVRFYERQGLLDEPARKASGYRLYSEDVIPRLQFIKRAKELGFSLGEIADLLSLGVDSSATCEEVRRRATEKIEEISGKIDDLSRMKCALEALVSACDEGTGSACPLLEALAQQETQ
jgi:MerR family copper efflux transcriptional regulator